MKRIYILSVILLVLTGLFSVNVSADDFSVSEELVISKNYTVSGQWEHKYFEFSPSQDGIYRFVVEDSRGVAYLYDSDKKIIGSGWDEFVGFDYEIIYKMSKDKVYYFEVVPSYEEISININLFDENSVEMIEPNVQYSHQPDVEMGEATPDMVYFCVPEDGYYCAYLTGEGDCSGNMFISGAEPLYSNYDIGWGQYNSYIYTPLKKDFIYPIKVSCGMRGSRNTGVNYVIYLDDMMIKGNYKVGDVIESRTTASHTIYSFVPEQSGEIVIKNGYEYEEFYLYDAVFGIKTSASWSYATLNYEVKKGGQYYIVLGTGDYKIQSEFIEKADNAEVITSNIEDMQSGHCYPINLDKTWKYIAKPGTKYIEVELVTELLDDTLYVYNSSGELYKTLTGGKMSKNSFVLIGDSFSLRLVSNSEYVGYGFSVASLIEYTDVKVPVASIQSGTIRQSEVSLTAQTDADIFYKLSVDGEYVKYSTPIEIRRNCTLYAYAQIGEYKSEVAEYSYIIDNSSVAPPVITGEKLEYGDYIISFSAEEGTVYYKKLLSNSEYIKYTSGNIYVDSNDIIVAYAQAGLAKSDYVYFECDIEESGKFELSAPKITVEDIVGGKRVTIVSNELLGYSYEENNMCGDHRDTQCGKNGFKHTMENWSREDKNAYMRILSGGATTSNFEYNYYENTYTIDLYESTYISAKNLYEFYKEEGPWLDYASGTRVTHTTMHPEMDTISYIYDDKEGKTSFLFVEISESSAPEIYFENGKTVITTANGEDIYYSINGGEYIKYTAPLTLSASDKVTAYSVGVGVAKSEETESLVAEANGSLSISNNKIEFEVCVANKLEEKDGVVIAAAYKSDGKTLLDAETTDLKLKTGYNYTENIALNVGNEKKAKVKIFVWNSLGNMQSFTEVKTYDVN